MEIENYDHETYYYIDLYDQVVNERLVDIGFHYDSWTGNYFPEDISKRLFQLKVKGYFDEE